MSDIKTCAPHQVGLARVEVEFYFFIIRQSSSISLVARIILIREIADHDLL